MKIADANLDRLLRAAAGVPNGPLDAIPFGFETRMVARWRAGWNGEFADLTLFLRRVVLMSLGVIVLAGAGAYQELRQADDFGEPFSDGYAIADSVIGVAFDQ
jgi:hypothetical protein